MIYAGHCYGTWELLVVNSQTKHFKTYLFINFFVYFHEYNRLLKSRRNFTIHSVYIYKRVVSESVHGCRSDTFSLIPYNYDINNNTLAKKTAGAMNPRHLLATLPSLQERKKEKKRRKITRKQSASRPSSSFQN